MDNTNTVSTMNELAEELVKFLRKNPSHPNAGSFAEAAAHLFAVQSGQARERSNWDRLLVEVPKLMSDLEAKFASAQEARLRKQDERAAKKEKAEKAKPEMSKPERRAYFEQAIQQGIAQAVARDLIQEATGLEQLAAIGRSTRDFGKVTEGAIVRPTIDDSQRELAKKQAAQLKSRAVEVLVAAGCNPGPGILSPYGM
jgi:hypothetical protein